MTYTASKELAHVLLTLGFSETTKIRYPEHFKKMLVEGYNPGVIKRSFVFDRSLYIIFDYINITIWQKGFGGLDRLEWNQSDLKSLKTFLKLPKESRKKLTEDKVSVLKITEKCKELSSLPHQLIRKHELALLDSFKVE